MVEGACKPWASGHPPIVRAGLMCPQQADQRVHWPGIIQKEHWHPSTAE